MKLKLTGNQVISHMQLVCLLYLKLAGEPSKGCHLQQEVLTQMTCCMIVTAFWHNINNM